MTAALLAITARALLNRRRTLLLALLGVLLVAVTVIYRLANPNGAESLGVTRALLGDFGLGVLLPVVAVIVGTAVLGSELDDGTIVYLLAKPVPRWRIVLVKMLVAWLVVVLLVVLAMLVAGLIGHEEPRLTVAYAVAATVGALEYTALFLALSLATSRALIVGLAYVMVWEGVVAGLFAGTRIFSVRQHALAVAEAVGGESAAQADLAAAAAIGVAAAVTVLAVWFAIRRLERVELRGETA
jgi:ABC-2 type transport system permease protein